ncbi:MAG: hypothetical protein ACRD6R_12865, partial [Candidatus Polarisedimenticolia bacterium]
RLNAGGGTFTAPLEVRLDPRVTTTKADLDLQFEWMMRIRDLLGDVHRTVLEIRSARGQIADLAKRLPAGGEAETLAALGRGIDQKMGVIEEELIEVRAKSSQDMCNYPTRLSSKVAWLSRVVDSADAAPTQQARELYQQFRGRADAGIAAWRALVAGDIADLNGRAKSAGVPAVALPATPSGTR